MADSAEVKLDYLIEEVRKLAVVQTDSMRVQTKLAVEIAESKIYLKNIRESGCTEGRTLIDRVHGRVDETHSRINRQTKWMTGIGAAIFGLGAYVGSLFRGN